MKYKGEYRLKPNLDVYTNDFPRTDDGSIDPSYDDIYIKCANGSQIYHYGHSTLVAYIPSLGRAHNILIAIAKELELMSTNDKSRNYEEIYSKLENDGTIFNIVENDEEVEFKFNAKHIELIAKYMKPQTSGADISPFSSRNLPKAPYTIPAYEMIVYKEIVDAVPKEDKLTVSHITNDFISNILAKDRLYKTVAIKTDMRQKMLKGKEYIHSMGYWDRYIEYLKENLC